MQKFVQLFKEEQDKWNKKLNTLKEKYEKMLKDKDEELRRIDTQKSEYKVKSEMMDP